MHGFRRSGSGNDPLTPPRLLARNVPPRVDALIVRFSRMIEVTAVHEVSPAPGGEAALRNANAEQRAKRNKYCKLTFVRSLRR